MSIIIQLIHLHILNEDINSSNLSLQSNCLYKKRVNMSSLDLNTPLLSFSNIYIFLGAGKKYTLGFKELSYAFKVIITWKNSIKRCGALLLWG